MRVVHLPVYRDNAYQPQLMEAQRRRGLEAIDGGGGGRFLRTAISRWRPDVVHFHWLHPYLLRKSRLGSIVQGIRFLAAVAVLRLWGCRIVWTLHNLQNHDRRHTGLERWFTRQFVRLAHVVIAHCKAAVELGKAKFGGRAEKWRVVPHPSYIGHFPDTVSKAEARKKLGLGDEELVFGFLGRIEAYKGLTNLVKEFRQLSLPGVRLLLAGKAAPDSDMAIREAMAASDAIIYRPGFVPDDEVQKITRSSDVLIFPYRDILTSSGVLLAMTFGRPVIAPKLGCIPEAIGAGNELLYEPDSPDGLKSAIQESVTRRVEWEAIGNLNRMKAEKLTWENCAADTYRIYEDVLKDSGP